MIEIKNAEKYFNHHKKSEIHVINNTSLKLPKSGLIALLGPSGCGKTTLLNVIGGLDKINSGKIYINDEKITKRCTSKVDKIRNINIGYIFQNYNLLDNKTVFDNVAISLEMIGVKNKEEIKRRVNEVLEILGIYRYRNRNASMLSGGERQRVAIARAIIKNPDIILADEPTGNLDSENTLEIMNIIKSISKNRLVLLVTHEVQIAKFYADRILEIVDGTITKDYKNENNEKLDYQLENKFYLKDFKYVSNFTNKDNEINIYNNNQNDIKLTIVVKNNNIYIKGSKSNKIEIVDESSNIEFINDHYQEIDKSIYEKYEFKMEDNNHKKRYSSINSLFKSIKNGFKKLLSYSIIKKLLLLGFLASSVFVSYSIYNIFGVLNIKDEYFIEKNKDYYDVVMPKIDNKKYNEIKMTESVKYVLPGNSFAIFKVEFPFFLQTRYAYGLLKGSIVTNEFLDKDDLLYGNLPQNKYEIVVDKMVIQNMIDDSNLVQVGITKPKQLINFEAKINYINNYKIVGITDLESPSIYVSEDILLDIISGSNNDIYVYNDIKNASEEVWYLNYLNTEINLVKGRLPENDFEIIVNKNYEYEYPLNKEINEKINTHKLKVVGYYDNNTKLDIRYVNKNTLENYLIENKKDLTIYPNNNNLISELSNIEISARSSYETSLNSYKEFNKTKIKNTIILSSIFLAISLIEVYLMTRSSFLSRIKEIGVLRAIGVKKMDIYKMFIGEIIAIIVVSSIPGVIITTYILKALNTFSYIRCNYLINIPTFLISVLVIFAFNIISGLIPVMLVIRKKPAEILARKDID